MSPVPSSMAAVMATTRGSRSICSQSASAKRSVKLFTAGFFATDLPVAMSKKLRP
jgi:hypothetical protein